MTNLKNYKEMYLWVSFTYNLPISNYNDGEPYLFKFTKPLAITKPFGGNSKSTSIIYQIELDGDGEAFILKTRKGETKEIPYEKGEQTFRFVIEGRLLEQSVELVYPDGNYEEKPLAEIATDKVDESILFSGKRLVAQLNSIDFETEISSIETDIAILSNRLANSVGGKDYVNYKLPKEQQFTCILNGEKENVTSLRIMVYNDFYIGTESGKEYNLHDLCFPERYTFMWLLCYNVAHKITGEHVADDLKLEYINRNKKELIA